MVRRKEMAHGHVRPQGWRPHLTTGVAAHISGARGGCRRNCPIDCHPPRPTPPISWNRSRDPRKFSLGCRPVNFADDRGRERPTWGVYPQRDRLKAKRIHQRQHGPPHLATSMSPGTRWPVSSSPVRNRGCTSGYHTTLAVYRDQPCVFWSRGKVNGWQHEVRKRG